MKEGVNIKRGNSLAVTPFGINLLLLSTKNLLQVWIEHVLSCQPAKSDSDDMSCFNSLQS